MALRNSWRCVCLAAMLLGLSACGADLGGPGGGPGAGPFGAPANSPLLAPFAGNWVFDFEKTLDARKAAGARDDEIEKLRKFYADNPQFGKMHPDMTITGNVAVCSGFPAAEYRFFAMHEDDGKVCGKAWHHEDRYDPGDMSKCCVRLAIREGQLYFETRMKEGLPDLNDADLRSSPPAESGSAGDCDADNPAGNDWSEWTTLVFVRKP